MLTCVFTLTACGADEAVSEIQQSKIDAAESRAKYIVEEFKSIIESDVADSMLESYNNVELSEIFTQNMSVNFEGTSVRGALTSFKSGIEDMGGIVSIGDMTSKADDDTITVIVDVTGTNKNGSVELIFSNDIFLILSSCTLNVDQGMGSLMAKAGLNTLMGMGTVFIVLILISLIISLFGYIPKLTAKPEKKDEQVEVPKAAAPVVEQAQEELSDDEELVAVIAAAIAAYEGTSADGFQVRSIKRANTKNWYRA